MYVMRWTLWGKETYISFFLFYYVNKKCFLSQFKKSYQWKMKWAIAQIKETIVMFKVVSFFKIIFSLFYFLNYESKITYLQETWEIQNKFTYSSI